MIGLAPHGCGAESEVQNAMATLYPQPIQGPLN